ncbi:hypothetical protein BDP55DRAFT_646477 [Colletotrichum godetiae]|uniref:Secreted protein n=1 Tax=Colletotrichum godetiae TaxID=1209918 RepID=A0AAJ0F384_9PEZI|nr:uncharacterized protein BDP55DRAFT_646477 [Colletotrichum godetiae]KAK1691257.1 hypothetical protein BDP55DRAFT_646477 [Colletotrichum godetiae]
MLHLSCNLNQGLRLLLLLRISFCHSMASKNDQLNAQKPPSSTGLLVLTTKIPDRGTDSGRVLSSSSLLVSASQRHPNSQLMTVDWTLFAAQTPRPTSYQQCFARASRPVDLSGSAQSLVARCCAPLNYA